MAKAEKAVVAPPLKECLVTKPLAMENDSNNLLLFHSGIITENEAAFLRKLILSTETSEQFCKAHELVNRNRITSSKKKIMKEYSLFQLRPFRFLINKN